MVHVERRSMSPAPREAAPTSGRATVRREEVPFADVVDRVIDRGMMIDAQGRATLLLIDFDIDAQAVVASIDTYLRFARTVSRRDLEDRRRPARRIA
jgi:hypothetical protein